MKTFLFGLIIIVFASCNFSRVKKPSIAEIKSPIHKLPAISYNPVGKKILNDTSASSDQLDTYADYYVVVIDTGKNYYTLRDKMLNLHQLSGLTIDTGEQTYNKKKDLISLPESKDENDIDAGQYSPRRQTSENLSLEYLDFYKKGADKKTIALVAGIYENKTSADSLLKALPSPNGAFAFKAKVYVGCMH